MKKLIIVFLFIPILGLAQTKKDIFNPDVPVIFFGADFSRVQFTKADEFTNKSEILRFFVDMNNMLENAYVRMLTKELKRESIKTDFSYVTKVNAMVEWEKVYSDNIDYTLSDQEIGDMIKNLNIDQAAYKDHIGMVLCNENFCKTKTFGKIATVFFTVNDLNPIFIKRYSLKPMGYGFLNYWGFIDAWAVVLVKKLPKEIE
jgi:hypothetical protein